MSEKSGQRWDALLSRLPADRSLVGAEVGVWRGRLSERLLAARPRLVLWLVDRWRAPKPDDSYYSSGAQMARHPQAVFERAYHDAIARTGRYADRAHVVRCDSVEAAARFRDGYFDFVFLDGDHSYAGVSRDLRAWAPKVRPGGLLCGHDYGREDQGDVEAAVFDYLVCRKDEPLAAGQIATDCAYTWFWRVP